jgi:Kef-type K+ transport system membrane component KefB
MNFDSIIFELAVIIVGAAALGTLFLYARQPLLVAYMAIGFAVGPNGFSLIKSIDHIEQIAHFGVILLLFLIGLNLQPTKLIKLFGRTVIVTLGTSFLFGSITFLFALILKFDMHSALLFGAAMLFSSTVISLKLLPATELHHRRTGEILTSVLLMQDIVAILVILFVTGETSDHVLVTFALLTVKFTLLFVLAFIGVRYVFVPLLRRFEAVQEYTFIATLGWCLLWAEAAHHSGLSYEIGAFVAGISIASCKNAIAIAERLKPLREFFLVLFFFAIGAELSIGINTFHLVAAVLFGVLMVPLKVIAFRFAFRKRGESLELSRELAVRLGQSSEFSLLVVFAALSAGVLSVEKGMVIQITTITTFIISTYWVVLKYPTPISE